jgi:hypothetical protein
VEAGGALTVSGDVIWPDLILKYDYRSYLRRKFSGADQPELTIAGRAVALPPVRRVSFDGMLHFEHAPTESGLVIRRTLFPARRAATALDRWEITNTGTATQAVQGVSREAEESRQGPNGDFVVSVRVRGGERRLGPGESLVCWVEYAARAQGETAPAVDPEEELKARRELIGLLAGQLQLRTPDAAINAEFDLIKLRASESIFATKKLGVVHSPGGGRYYGGVWANDQIEYANPFFAYLDYGLAQEAALNACRAFMPYMTPEYRAIPYAFEMGGAMPSTSKDRGDAAMYAYGTSLNALTRADKNVARELWPAIKWCLEYCERKLTPEGVVASQSDEMEGRIATGNANLSTSTLAYGALLNAAVLARELGEPAEVAARYQAQADALRAAIERHFGAEIEGYHTYRYFDGHDKIRHWICLPLVMGIEDRRDDTIRALLEKLWTPNGLLVENGLNIFWDRATLYMLRGLFATGATEQAFTLFSDYTRRRLLGDHVPYPVEAWPEGGQAHLSAESALYGRVIIEGMFGLKPAGFDRFVCTPRLPQAWPEMALGNIHAYGAVFSVSVRREASGALSLSVTRDGKTVFRQTAAEGTTHRVNLE